MTLNRRRWAVRLLGLLGVFVVGMLMLSRFEHSQVYHPMRGFIAKGSELGRPFEDVYLISRDGTRLHGWYFPSSQPGPGAGLAFLVCHGNGGNISHRLDVTEGMLQTGAAVLLFDYRGYGRSEGRPSEAGTYEDAQAAYAWLRTKGFAADTIIGFGESLGGGVATELAVRERLGGLVLMATFTSIPDIGAEIFPWLPVRWMAKIRYDNLSKLARVDVPVLIMHSRQDDLVRFTHAERNYAAIRGRKLLFELQGSHNEGAVNKARFRDGLEKLVEMMSPKAIQES